MVVRRRTARSIFILVAGIVFFPASIAVLVLDIPVGGWDVEVGGKANPPFFLTPKPPKNPPGGLTVPDQSGLEVSALRLAINKTNVSSLEFTLGVAHGHGPVDLASLRLGFTDVLYDDNMVRNIGDGGDESWSSLEFVYNRIRYYDTKLGLKGFRVIEDPWGAVESGRLEEGAHIRLASNSSHPLGGKEMLICWAGDAEPSIFAFGIPGFLTTPQLGSRNCSGVEIDDGNGTYPRPGQNDSILLNNTIIENTTYILDRRIFVLGGGRLELRNCVVEVDENASEKSAIIVGYGGVLVLENVTFERDRYYRRWGFSGPPVPPISVYGTMMARNSTFGPGTASIQLLSDDALLENNTIHCPVICTGCSPDIRGNRFYRYWDEMALRLEDSGARISKNLFVGIFIDHPRIYGLVSGWLGNGITAMMGSSPVISANMFINETRAIHVIGPCSPRIYENDFNRTRQGIVCVGAFAIISENRLNTTEEGIRISNRGYCRVSENRISSGLPVVVGPHGIANITGNTLESLFLGINISYNSSADIISNNISASNGIDVLCSFARVSGNTIADYTNQGVLARSGNLELLDNRFSPSQTARKKTFSVVKEWAVVLLPMGANSDFDPIFAQARIFREPVTGDPRREELKRTDVRDIFDSYSYSYFEGWGYESLTTNDGRRIGVNAQRFTVELQGGSGSFSIVMDSPAHHRILIKKTALHWFTAFVLPFIAATMLVFGARSIHRDLQVRKAGAPQMVHRSTPETIQGARPRVPPPEAAEGPDSSLKPLRPLEPPPPPEPG